MIKSKKTGVHCTEASSDAFRFFSFHIMFEYFNSGPFISFNISDDRCIYLCSFQNTPIHFKKKGKQEKAFKIEPWFVFTGNAFKNNSY